MPPGTFHVYCCGSGGRTPSERTSACGPSSPITSSLKRASCLQVPGLVPTRPAELSEDKTHSEQAYPAITDVRADIALRALGHTRSFGDVGSMSGLPESGQDWAIYELLGGAASRRTRLPSDYKRVALRCGRFKGATIPAALSLVARVMIRARLPIAMLASLGIQARHRAGSPMFRDQLVATKSGLPVALTAGDKYGISQLVGEAVEGLRDC